MSKKLYPDAKTALENHEFLESGNTFEERRAALLRCVAYAALQWGRASNATHRQRLNAELNLYTAIDNYNNFSNLE